MAASLVKDDLERVSERIEVLETLLDQKGKEFQPLLHPAMAQHYRNEVMLLRETLNKEDSRAEASEHLRGLIEKIVLTPRASEEGLQIDLHGDLAGILSMAMGNKDISEVQNLKRLRLLSSNDNNAEALVDSVGSGGRI